MCFNFDILQTNCYPYMLHCLCALLLTVMSPKQHGICLTKGFCPQNLCKELHQKIDVVDEERYDIDSKVTKNSREVSNICE